MNGQLTFRFAVPGDEGLILSFIRALAEYEHLADQVVATEALLREWIFERGKAEVLFADAVTTSEQSILVGDLAKLLKQNGVDMGQNRLFQWLRDRGYLMKQGSSKNMPMQRSMDMGLFEVKERTINNPDGSVRITKTTKVTGKGQQYFINQFMGAN